MNKLERVESGLLGSRDALYALERADQARLLVLSDTHGHYDLFESIVREYGPSSDALLFAGDGMWDVVQYVENAHASERLRVALPPVVAFVAGNGDGDQYRVCLPSNGPVDEPSEAPGFSLTVPQRLVVKACGFSVLLAHGHRHSVDVNPEILVSLARSLACDVAVHGHTHIPFAEEFTSVLVLNPGSPSRPRGHTGPSFALVDLESTVLTPKVTFCAVSEAPRGGFAFGESPARL